MWCVAMASNIKIGNVVIDEQKLEAAECEGVMPLVQRRAEQIQQRVQGMSAGFTTGRFYDRQAKEMRGGTSPDYGIKPVKRFKNTPVALVYTGNYAAMKFEHEHNALLKASR